jgi:hypothetical protein
MTTIGGTKPHHSVRGLARSAHPLNHLDELWLGARGPLIGEGVYLAIQERGRKAGL